MLVSYARSLVRGWVVLVVGTILGAVAGFALTAAMTPVYTADTQLFVSTNSTSQDLSAAVAGTQLAMDRASSYAQLLVGKELATNVVDQLGLKMTPTQLMSEISATVVADTVIIDVAVTDASASRAYNIARAIGPQFESLVQQVEGGESARAPVVTVTVVSSPELPTAPSAPNRPLDVAAGLILGLTIAAVVAVVRDRLDTRLRSEEDTAVAADAPVLGLVPEDAGGAGGRDAAGSSFAESFRMVETNLRFVSVDSAARVLMVTSSHPAEGKTTTAINVARGIAESGRRVLLVDADLRRPRVARDLGLVSGVGLTQVLTGDVTVDEVVQPVGDGALSVLDAGPTPPNPTQLLAGRTMSALLHELAGRYDVVVLDSPPLLPVADAAALAPLADGVLLCARWGAVRREDLARSRSQLDRADATTLGVVLTFTPTKAAGYSYGYGVPQPVDRHRRWGWRSTAAQVTTSPAAPAAERRTPTPQT